MTIAAILNQLSKPHLVEDLGFRPPDVNDMVMGDSGTWYLEPGNNTGQVLVMFNDDHWNVYWGFGASTPRDDASAMVTNRRQLHRALQRACADVGLPELKKKLYLMNPNWKP